MAELGIRRREVLRVAAWSVPAVAVAVSAPAVAMSGPLPTLNVTLTPTFSSNGVSLYLREGKVVGPAPGIDTSTTNTRLAQVQFKITDAAGLPIVGAQVIVDGGNAKDGEGNYLLGVFDLAAPATGPTSTSYPESPVKRSATVLSDAAGFATVKIATATWSKADCPTGYVGQLQVPTTGVVTVQVSVPGYATTTVPYSYIVYDAGILISCP